MFLNEYKTEQKTSFGLKNVLVQMNYVLIHDSTTHHSWGTERENELETFPD